MPGESVVVSGNFLVDSESRMKLAAAGLRGALLKDPSCGMEVYADKARKEGLMSSLDGKTYYFCSKECKALFDGTHGKDAGVAASEARPGKPGIQNEESMDGLWRDPVCGKLLPADKAKALGLSREIQGRTVYFCSEQCRNQFDRARKQDQEKAAGKAPDPSPGHGGHRHD